MSAQYSLVNYIGAMSALPPSRAGYTELEVSMYEQTVTVKAARACVWEGVAGGESRGGGNCSERHRAMDKYEQLTVVGEGSYGVVLKCRHRDSGQLVAIKKFLETEEDPTVRKMALREIRMLKKLRHDHLVNMLEVFRRKRRFYLVFEYLDHTLLDELEAAAGGLGEDTAKKHLFQLLRGIDFCHQNSIIHRDVKPENVLVSRSGVVKLCDFGFARTLAAPGEPYTEYVATRWYRAPELLVADPRYGSEVDIWAIGCLFAEMLTGDPLFPGDSDIDQLALIMKIVGKLAPRHQQVVSRLAGSSSARSDSCLKPPPPPLPGVGLAKELVSACLRTEPRARPSAVALLRHRYFTADGFAEAFSAELRKTISKEIESMPLVRTAGNGARNTAVARAPKHQHTWSLSFVPDQNQTSVSHSTTVSNSDNYIDYNYTNADVKVAKKPQNGQMWADSRAESVSPPTFASLPPARAAAAAPHPAPTQRLMRALNTTFNAFPVPVTSYPKTQHIKKVNRAQVIEDTRPEPPAPVYRRQKQKLDFSLPNVPGATNSPMKNSKKPQPAVTTAKIYDNWENSNMEVSQTPCSNLPYM